MTDIPAEPNAKMTHVQRDILVDRWNSLCDMIPTWKKEADMPAKHAAAVAREATDVNRYDAFLPNVKDAIRTNKCVICLPFEPFVNMCGCSYWRYISRLSWSAPDRNIHARVVEIGNASRLKLRSAEHEMVSISRAIDEIDAMFDKNDRVRAKVEAEKATHAAKKNAPDLEARAAQATKNQARMIRMRARQRVV
jgi:hypothetical protein